MKRFALIGSGNIACKHAGNLRKLRCLPVFLCSSGTKKSMTFRKNYEFENFTSCYTDIKDIDFVVVATPSPTHFEIVKHFIAKKIPVFCEKPLVTNRQDAMELKKIILSETPLVYVNFQLRYKKVFKRVKELLKSGKLGTFRAGWVIKGREMPSKDWYHQDSNVALELGIHYLDLFQWLLDKNVQELAIKRIDNKFTDDNVFVWASFDHNQELSVVNSFTYPYMQEQFVVIGTEKYLAMRNGNIQIRDIDKRRGVKSFFQDYFSGFGIEFSYFSQRAHYDSLKYFLEVLGDSKPRKELVGDTLEGLSLLEKVLQYYL